MSRWIFCLVLAAVSCGATEPAPAPLRVAVAANFAPTLRLLAQEFEADGGAPVEVIVGSTGKLYAQILNGAPYDLFFAADALRPARLVESGRVRPEDRFPYAVGRLVLWSPDPDLVDGEGRVLDEAGNRRLALANPRLAPYGRAAQEALSALGVESVWATRTVTGENVAQVLHFVDSGNADFGLVALSQLIDRDGSRWIVPAALHAPIVQHLVVLSDRPAARAFAAYAVSAAVCPLLEARGYRAPGESP